MTGDKLKNINKIIDAEEFRSGGILDRAQDAAMSNENEKTVKDIIVARSKKCKKYNKGRK